MVQLSNQQSWKPWQGVLVFIGTLLLLIFPGSLLQLNLGMTGLILSQLIFLAFAILVTKLHKTPLKEVFPVGKLSVRDIFGVIVFAIGAILANLTFAAIGIALFPDSVAGTQETANFLYGNGLPPVLIVLIVSLTPAICEESIMRGALLSHFRGLKKDWVVCLIVGICFGILHLDPVKFLSTAVLGALLAYLVVKRNNILLASIVHFLNNFLSSMMGVLSSGATESAGSEAGSAVTVSPLGTLGTFFIICFLAPVILVLGAKLLKLTNITKKSWIIASIISVVMLFAGIGCTFAASAGLNAVCSFTAQTTLTDDQPAVYEMVIEEDGQYQIVLSGSVSGGGADVEIVNVDTDEVVTTDSITGLQVVNQTLNLEPGNYEIRFTENTDATSAEFTLSAKVVMLSASNSEA